MRLVGERRYCVRTIQPPKMMNRAPIPTVVTVQKPSCVAWLSRPPYSHGNACAIHLCDRAAMRPNHARFQITKTPHAA